MRTSTLAYRSDIDGLRAVAVGSVVLFHAGVQGFGGGFVGVDIFFVISGYLITSILLTELAEGRFSIVRFYERRVKRIFPALFAMLAVSSLVAAALLLPHDLADFGDSLAAATLFVSNVYFWQTADYFAGPAHLKPLLHTWSLSVEEQFYIAFPLLLAAIVRWGNGRLGRWLLALFVLSLVVSEWSATNSAVASFYLAPSRAWELLVGSLVALAVSRGLTLWQPLREGCGVLGLLLIAYSVATFSTATVFPGFNALVPCLGAALVILSGLASPVTASRLLSHPRMVELGLISYSLYLWHWPVLVFARHWNGGPLSPMAIAVAIAASVGLAVASWRWVEQPFRGGGLVLPRPRLFIGAAGAMAAALAFGMFADLSKGWPGRLDGYQRPEVAGREALKEGQCFLTPGQGPWNYAGPQACRGGGYGGLTVVVWGDSFAAHLMPGLASRPESTTGFVQYTASGCPPVIGLELANRPHCRAVNDHALRIIDELEPEVVILSARWETYLPRVIDISRLQATIDVLNGMGYEVVVVGQSPTFDFAHPYDETFRSRRPVTISNAPPAIEAMLRTLRGAHLFDVAPLFCEGETCRFRERAEYLFFDGGHFSLAGSAKVSAALAPLIESPGVSGLEPPKPIEDEAKPVAADTAGGTPAPN
ncbi:MAG: acyltransferase family protein [Hyphomicrobium sp.]